MPGLSIGCEVQGCCFTTPELDPSFYPSMVIQLQIHHSSIHTEAARGSTAHQSLMPSPPRTPALLISPVMISGRSQAGSWLVDELVAESAQTSPENERQEEKGRSGEEGVSPKLKGITRGKTRSSSAAINRSLIKKKSLPTASLLSSALVSNPQNMKKLGSMAKAGTKNTMVGLKRPRLDLQFLCTECNLVSFNTAKGLLQHNYRYCKSNVSADIIVKLGDRQNNSLPNTVVQKTYRIQLNTSSQEKLLCPDCQEKSYSTLMGLTMHRRKFCRNKRPGIFCFNCNKVFTLNSTLSRHVQKCVKTQENVGQNEGFKNRVSKGKEDEDQNKDQEQTNTEAVQDKETPETKVMITVEFTSQELIKTKLRWKVPVLAPIERIMKKVCIKFSQKMNLLLFTVLGNEVNPGNMAGQYGGKVIQATLRVVDMTLDLDIEELEDL